MSPQLYLGVSGILFLVLVFIGSFVFLQRAQKAPENRTRSNDKRALTAEEERKLTRRLERDALREERERQEQATKEAAETARASSYQEKLRKREQEREARELHNAQESHKKAKDLDAWKASIKKVDEGIEQTTRDLGSVEDFIDYIRRRKVIEVESLASSFRLDITSVVCRINDLIDQSRIFGVFDDRGRFIHINEDEGKKIQDLVSRMSSRMTVRSLCSDIGILVSSKQI